MRKIREIGFIIVLVLIAGSLIQPATAAFIASFDIHDKAADSSNTITEKIINGEQPTTAILTKFYKTTTYNGLTLISSLYTASTDRATNIIKAVYYWNKPWRKPTPTPIPSTPTPTPPTPTPTSIPTFTPHPTPTPTTTPTIPVPTHPTPILIPTPAVTPTPTSTPKPPTVTPTFTPSPIPTPKPTLKTTPSPVTPTPTPTPTQRPMSTPTPKPTTPKPPAPPSIPTPTPTPTLKTTPSPVTPTSTPNPTFTPTPTQIPTVTPISTLALTPTPPVPTPITAQTPVSGYTPTTFQWSQAMTGMQANLTQEPSENNSTSSLVASNYTKNISVTEANFVLQGEGILDTLELPRWKDNASTQSDAPQKRDIPVGFITLLLLTCTAMVGYLTYVLIWRG